MDGVPQRVRSGPVQMHALLERLPGSAGESPGHVRAEERGMLVGDLIVVDDRRPGELVRGLVRVDRADAERDHIQRNDQSLAHCCWNSTFTTPLIISSVTSA